MIDLAEVWFAGYARMPDERLKELVRAADVAPLRIQYDPATSCVVIGQHYYPAEGVARMTLAEGASGTGLTEAPRRRGRPPKVRCDE